MGVISTGPVQAPFATLCFVWNHLSLLLKPSSLPTTLDPLLLPSNRRQITPLCRQFNPLKLILQFSFFHPHLLLLNPALPLSPPSWATFERPFEREKIISSAPNWDKLCGKLPGYTEPKRSKLGYKESIFRTKKQKKGYTRQKAVPPRPKIKVGLPNDFIFPRLGAKGTPPPKKNTGSPFPKQTG